VAPSQSVPARILYSDHNSLAKRYSKVIFALARNSTPESEWHSWIGIDDRVGEAWETVYRIYRRYGHLCEPDFGNVLVRSVRNCQVSLKAKIGRSCWIQGTYMEWSDRWISPQDKFSPLIIRLSLFQLKGHLRIPVQRVLECLVGDSSMLNKRGRIDVGALARNQGRSPETIRTYLKETVIILRARSPWAPRPRGIQLLRDQLPMPRQDSVRGHNGRNLT